MPFTCSPKTRHCTQCSGWLGTRCLSIFQAIAQANLAGIQNLEHQRGKVIQQSVAGSCSAWASPGLKTCWIWQPGWSGFGAVKVVCESHASYGKTSTETLVTPSTKPQPTQGLPSIHASNLPSHSPSSIMPGSSRIKAAEFSSHAPWGCCLCFWPGQEGTCANGLLSVNACSELL